MNASGEDFINFVFRFGDIDLDGQRDFIVNLRKKSEQEKPFVVVFRNEDCPDSMKNELQASETGFDMTKCRFFKSLAADDRFKSLSSKTSPLTSFFDWGEAG